VGTLLRRCMLVRGRDVLASTWVSAVGLEYALVLPYGGMAQTGSASGACRNCQKGVEGGCACACEWVSG
jgi:hypothetical protein